MLRIYHAWVFVHGVVFFSSRVYPAGGAGGTAEETAPFIHNYPLIYAVNGRPVESYAVTPSLHYGSYAAMASRRQGRLRYPLVEQVLSRLVDGDLCGLVYAYPAAPKRIVVQKFFMSAQGMGYPEFRGRLKVGFPRLVNLIGLGPGSELETFLVSDRDLPRRIYARLGMKRMGSILLVLDEASVAGEAAGEPYSSHPVNLGDTASWGYRPRDAAVVLETRSIPWLDGSLCHGCAKIGYISARGIALVRWRDSVAKRAREALLPLPLPLRPSAGQGTGRPRPAW